MGVNERRGWTYCLSVFGVLAAFSLGVSIGSRWVAFEPLAVVGAAFLAIFIAWLFRLTFLAGKRRGDS